MPSKTLNVPAYSEQAFLNCFLQQVFHDARWMPKVQLERIIGPLLTPFIGRLMTKVFQDHNELHGPYKLICEEFPLLKDRDTKHKEDGNAGGTYRSTNVDWLLQSVDNRNLLFLELKTNEEKPRDEQLSRYLRVRGPNQSKNAFNAKALRDDIDSLCQAKASNSSKSRKIKYQHLSRKLAHTWSEVSASSNIGIVYLGPKKIKTAFDELAIEERPDAVLCFHDLPDIIEGKHAECWSVIWKYLSTLDNPIYEELVDMPTLCSLYE